MKILVVGFDWFYPFTDFVVNGFKQNNCEVDRINYHYAENDLYLIRKLKQFNLYNKFKNISLKYTNKIVYKKNHNLLTSYIRNKKYDLIFIINVFSIHSQTIKEIKEIIGQKTCLATWYIDDPFIYWTKDCILKTENIKAMPFYDKVFVYDSYFIDSIKERLNKNVYYLPFGFDPDTFKKISIEKNNNISFIGTYTDERFNILSEIKNFGLIIYGGDWQSLNNKCNGIVKDQNICNVTYNKSYINFNLHHLQTVYGLNIRNFDVIGSGNFLLTDYRKDLENLFEIGKEIETYKSIDELKEKIKYYLDHSEKINEIAENGYKRAQNEHTYKQRMKTVLKLIQK